MGGARWHLGHGLQSI